LPIFHFWSILALFWSKKANKCWNRKTVFCSIFFCGRASGYQILKNVINQFRFLQFSSFLVNFGSFFGEKRPKNDMFDKQFFVVFSFVGKHLHTKFKQMSSKGLNFANFFTFGQFWLFLVKKGQKMLKSKNNFFEAFSFIGKHLDTKF